MFEDRRKSKTKKLILIFSLVFLSAFIISYFVNNGIEKSTEENQSKNNESLIIPSNVRNYTKTVKDNETPEELSYITNELTRLCYITHFKRCGHKIEKTVPIMEALVGLRIEELSEKIDDWQINDLKDDIIFLTKEIDTFCPKHFIIGVKDDNIAVYTYNESGDKILKEKTDININILTPEDQEFLMGGIVADTEDDMEIKLEGFSN